VFRGDVPRREFVAFWLADGMVLAGMNVNVWDVTDHIQRRSAPARRSIPTGSRIRPSSSPVCDGAEHSR
jgi:hypothetical protein